MLVFFTVCYIFSSYVKSLQLEGQHLLYEVSTPEAAHLVKDNNASKLASFIAQKDFNSALLVTLIDEKHRISILQHPKEFQPSQASIIIRDRNDRSGEPQTQGVFARLILGFATISGLQASRTHVKDIDIYVKENDRIFIENVLASMPAFLIIFFVGFILSYIFGNILARQALQPLAEVMIALENLSNGDFTPRTVVTKRNSTLARLVDAYNAAGLTIQNAIAERDTANLSMRKFASDAAHQLKTPITIVRGRLGILVRNLNESIEKHEKSITVIDTQCSLMADLVENLMLLDRWEQEPGHTMQVPVDIISLLTDILAMFCDTYADRSIVVYNEIGESALTFIEPREFTFMITNVLDNAIKYTDGKIEVFVSKHNNDMHLKVKDYGPGMSQAIQSRAFDRFFRGHRRDIEGSGLGLPIARAAIERAHGSITLESTVAYGSTVTMRIPLQTPRSL